MTASYDSIYHVNIVSCSKTDKNVFGGLSVPAHHGKSCHRCSKLCLERQNMHCTIKLQQNKYIRPKCGSKDSMSASQWVKPPVETLLDHAFCSTQNEQSACYMNTLTNFTTKCHSTAFKMQNACISFSKYWLLAPNTRLCKHYVSSVQA